MNIEDILSQSTDLIKRLNRDVEELKSYIPDDAKNEVDNKLRKVGL